MKISFFSLIIGIILVGYSLTMEPLKNKDLFYEKYMAMNENQSDDFFKLRDEMLTPKYRMQDTGILIILSSLIVISLLKLGKGTIVSPPKKRWFIAIAVALPFLTTSGYVFDLFQGAAREEFPHWADSLGIPLMGVPIQFGILMLWSCAHLFLIKACGSLPLSNALVLKLNPWLIFISLLTVLLIGLTAFYGQYWYAVPGLIWLYFYLSIGVTKLATQST